MKITTRLIVITMLLGFLNSSIANNLPNGTPQEEPSVYYTIYKIVTLGENRSKSENFYKSTILPSGITVELKDKIRKAKTEVLENTTTNVKTNSYNLKSGDRVIIYKLLYFLDKRPSWKIYSHRLKNTNNNYDKPTSFFIEKRISTSALNDYYKDQYEVLYDGMPFVIEENPSYFNDMYEFIKKNLFQYLNDDEKKEIKEHSTGIGVRG